MKTFCEFLVADVFDDGILGPPFLTSAKCKLDFATREFEVMVASLRFLIEMTGMFHKLSGVIGQ